MITIAYHFLGCRLNEAENEHLARAMTKAGYRMVTLQDHPDVIVLNTCGVTSEAMRKSRNYARRMAALHPSVLVLMGCAIDLMAAGELPLEDQVLEDIDGEGLPDKGSIEIVRILRDDRPNAEKIIKDAIHKYIHLNDICEDERKSAEESYRLRMRSFIKIEDGCNNQCTYCSVRLARGPEKSLPSEQILNEIRKCINLGEKEFVLTGVQVGAWKEDNRRLPDLIRDILDQTDVQRLRLSSIEPWHTKPELWRLWRDQRLCPHFHIPVQSGSDAVLSMMKRRTPIEGYLEKLDQIRNDIPGVRISTDIIVGFPGETEEMWQETLQFIQRASFDDVHLFTFSARPNTIAATLPGALSYEEKHKRWYQAEELINQIKKQRLENNIGLKCKVLWENISDRKPGYNLWHGYSQHYLKLMRWFEADKWMRGQTTDEVFMKEDIC